MLPLGRPCSFSDCAAGDLIRLTIGDGSTFAVAGGRDEALTSALLLSTNPVSALPISSYEPVLCYHKNYLIREGMTGDSIRHSGRSEAGILRLGADDKGAFATILCAFDNRLLYYDVTTGRFAQRATHTSLDITKWSVSLKADSVSSSITVFEKK